MPILKPPIVFEHLDVEARPHLTVLVPKSHRTLSDLGFPDILEALAARCRTVAGQERARARPLLSSVEEVGQALGLVDEARQLHAEPLSLPLSGVGDIRNAVERAAKGAVLEPSELIAITHELFSFERTRDTLIERERTLATMAAIARRLPELDRLATRLDRSFEPGGEISDRASPTLREARERTRGLHKNIKGRIDKLLADEKFEPNLRENYFSVRHERYVLPILAQHRAQVPGIVHNASQSGQTLFVEPQELISLGNDLAIAQSLVTDEERRILQELSGEVGDESGVILEGVAAAAMLDEAEAAARLSDALKSSRPEVRAPGGAVDLLSLRHPLLVLGGAQVVRNDVRLSEKMRTLVISGPNAGGKTVTLTAVGLCALMLKAGLPIPVEEGSALPLFDSVHPAIGDAQDLSQGLSTFSAHVSVLRDIGQVASPGSLVLIDEIGADTDPKEGAAIAIAVLEDLIERGARVLVTTHLEELKALAHVDERFANARVGVDAATMAPTYRLQLGAAGVSSAIEMAARVGLPAQICARARELALNAGGPLARALAATEEARQQLTLQLEQARADATATAAARQQQEQSQREFDHRRREEELRFRESLSAELEFARVQVRQLVDALKTRSSAEEATQAARELNARLEEQERAVAEVRTAIRKSEGPEGPADLRVGGKVRHLGLQKDVEILELVRNEAVVSAGALRMRVPISALAPARKTTAREAKFPSADRREAQLAKASDAAPRALALQASSCDVRGLRSDDALRDLEQFLDRALRQGEESALVVHGHGTGALKQSVRSYLESSPYVRGFRPGQAQEGGDGVTVVSLRS